MDELVFGRSTIAIFQNMGLSYNNDATKSTQPTGEAPKSFEGCPFDLHSLKEEVITNPGIKAKVKPILLSFNGLPDSGKTAAVDYVRKTYTTEGVAIKDVRSEIAEEAAEGIHYYQFIAASSSVTKNLIINEFTKKSCFAPSILSAFNERFLSQGKVPHLNIDEIYDTSVFDQPDLDEHIHFIYQFLSRQDFIGKSKKAEQLSDQERRDTENLIKALPEGIAVVNVWDVTINKIVRHFLAALQGHLYNQHTWLFLDLEDDIESLTMPPEEGGLMSWRPHLHYLLRQCMISKDNEKERRGVCTIIGKHNGMQNGNLQMKVQALESKVRPLAKHIGIATLLEDKIKTINLKSHNSTHTLCQNFERVINETPYEEIPVVWVFLRSLFYRFDWKIIARDDLKAMAEKCGMDDESLKGFCKFYTSFGSIFDLSLVDPDYQFVIVKPVQFLRKLNDLLQNDKFRQTGIVSESACRDMFDGHMTAFMDALVSLNLAARVIKSNLELEPNELTENDIFYYIPTLRKMNKEQLNPKSIHVLTSIDTPHIFKQATFTKHFLRLRPQAKLVPSKYRNQTIINDTATGTIITLTSFSPATNLHLDKPSEEVCSCIVQVYNDITKKSQKGM
ncbi:PREDICTED: uncharacterized protein LOC109581316 [Amphimedon queenslandica]|uniref:Uncharacterized protein n=1 Tax=Amphimedon queenslandica TaxID=400682 RepID=A0A1X7VVZ0_AMPQE|nr:PREDICTED: uncharacterized protein LOC109581316 [Amphimedon queenslandica]|eukprot:XP_019850926.1 PREDICTED: uncharacterized protein LOC109581316 [Amphimedon queenslandica]